MTCECKECLLGRKIAKVRAFLKDKDRDDLLEHLDELYSEYIHVSLDAEMTQAVIEKKWPQYKERMRKFGWEEEKGE